MEELSIEEKAQRYDEAKYIMKKYLESGNAGVIAENTIKKAFPELKESEDERIRKELIQNLKERFGTHGSMGVMLDMPRVIAWLEKQSTPQVRTGLEWVNTIDDACDKRYAEEYAHGEYCHEQSFKWGFQEGVDWLEKQCGQNHVNTPKFHEGDWIVHHGTENIYQVVAIIDNQYQLKYGDNYTVQKCADVDRCARLWDITKDAKDGDVLADKSNNRECPFIFKETKPSNIKTECLNPLTVLGYCGIGGAGFTKGSGWGDTANCIYYPATKEQRDTLMKAMSDAGYTFDFDKKELKKIEQKPTEWSEKTKGLDELETYILSIVPNRPLDAIKVDSKNIRFLINKEQKPAWSEDDEHHKRQILRILKDNGCSQTLQERTEKWIEERLKSLRPQSQWKPSGE